jgi:hypothetical protein
VQIRLTISEDNDAPAITNDWLRRSYSETYTHTLGLTNNKVEVAVQHLSEIQFVYVEILEGGPVLAYKNAGASYYKFSDFILLVGLEDCQRLALRAEPSAKVKVWMGGAS